MKRLKLSFKSKEKKKNSNFANFFLYASEKEKIKVFREAARRANDDQKNLMDSLDKVSNYTK